MADAPDPAVVRASFRRPNGFLKLIALVLIIVCIGLARGGFKGDPLGYNYIDYSWLVITTTCGFCIVMFLLIIGRAMGGMPPQVNLVALLLGTIMFIASGSVVIDTHNNSSLETYQPAMALGSICIAVALVMFVDMALEAKDLKK